MLIRWATREERKKFGYGEDFGEYDVLAAQNRMTGKVLGVVGFSREDKLIGEVQIFDSARQVDIMEKLTLCADRQCAPKGQSFHYRFPEYEKSSREEFCPCCTGAPQPPGLKDIAELEYAWVTAERTAQGRLFGKCHVLSKKHYVNFYDMASEDLAGFMEDVKKAAKTLIKVTGAVKINYEIHGNSGPHLHCHLFPRYLDDDFPGQGIDVNSVEPSPYESEQEFEWFFSEMQKNLCVMK